MTKSTGRRLRREAFFKGKRAYSKIKMRQNERKLKRGVKASDADAEEETETVAEEAERKEVVA